MKRKSGPRKPQPLPKIEGCPCGCQEATVFELELLGKYVGAFVQAACGSRGPNRRTKRLAIDSWNTHVALVNQMYRGYGHWSAMLKKKGLLK